MGSSIKLIVLLILTIKGMAEYKSAPYADWAHSHLVWMNAKDQSQTKLYKLIKTYKDNGIPVGAVNIDSLWSECINTFVVNRKIFPNMEQLVKDFHNEGIKVILWATPLVNKECPQFKQGISNKYFLNKGTIIKWWHGNGAFVDFWNPEAKKWFTGLMDRVLDMGFDGWKCDGADPLIYLLRPWPYSPALKRYIRYHEYANQFYGTFYNHTLTKNPQGLIMSRPVDSLQSFAFLKYSPKYVMFMGWVGDQYNNVDGFIHAMINVIHSASDGYLNFGFDIGGYKTKGDSQKWLFLRWVQVGALLPFMENGGGGTHEPWLFDQETVDIYRTFVLIHYDLKEFFLTAGTEAYSKGVSVLQPITKDKKIIEITHNYNLGYVYWNFLLVSPIFDQTGFVEVVFPKGSRWIYYFNHTKIFEGGMTLNMGIRLNQTACFMRSNSIVPVRKQLWLVYLQQGRQKKTIIGGKYSQEVLVNFNDGRLQIMVERFYKNQEVRQEMIQQTSIVVRLIGVGFSSQIQREEIKERLALRSTEYRNQFQVEVPFNQLTVLENITFSYGPMSIEIE